MKVGLIDTGHKRSMPHIGLGYLAAILRENGHSVQILDIAYSNAEEQVAFLSQHYGIIGITATSFGFMTCVKIAQKIKEKNPKQIIVVGGPHVCVARAGVLAEPSIDFAIYGEGEISLLKLVELLERNSSPACEELQAIPALIYRSGGQAVTNPAPIRLVDLDALPFPSYEGFPMVNYNTISLSTSRGCPFDCVYCATAAIWGAKWIARKPEKIVREIEYMMERWKIRSFNVVDDTFNLVEERVKQYCRLLIERNLNIKWSACGIRADKADTEMFRLMKESGCSSVCVGIESADPQVLENIGKKETIEQIRVGIARMKEAGLKVGGMFMIGNPGDTVQTVRKSIAFARELPLDDINFYLALPYPRTRLWTYVESQARFLRKDYVNFHDFSETPLFETDDFSFAERKQAYQEAMSYIREKNRHSISPKIIKAALSMQRSLRDRGLGSTIMRVLHKVKKLLFPLNKKAIGSTEMILTRAAPQSYQEDLVLKAKQDNIHEK